MLECRLTSVADLNWAMQRVRHGHQVHVIVPKPSGTRSSRDRQIDYAGQLIMAAARDALLIDVRHAVDGRVRQRAYVAEFTLIANTPEDPTGVREPRVPLPPLPGRSVVLDAQATPARSI